MSYEVSVVANYHKGEAFPFQLLIFLFTHNYLNTLKTSLIFVIPMCNIEGLGKNQFCISVSIYHNTTYFI